MAVTAQSIIKRVAVDILVDATSVRWPISELARFFNDGQRDIIVHRPDAMSTNGAVALVAGSKQTLAASATKLEDFHHNTGGNKRAVTRVPMSLLDEQLPGWHKLTGVTEILHYCYDERDPKTFYVYPPAAASGASLDGMWSALPTDIAEPADGGTFADVTGNLSLPDIFMTAMQNYIAYRCYSKDSETASNNARATAHYQLYANDLGVELKGTQGVAPPPASSMRTRSSA